MLQEKSTIKLKFKLVITFFTIQLANSLISDVRGRSLSLRFSPEGTANYLGRLRIRIVSQAREWHELRNSKYLLEMIRESRIPTFLIRLFFVFLLLNGGKCLNYLRNHTTQTNRAVTKIRRPWIFPRLLS